MAITPIDTTTNNGSYTGDPARVAFGKVNDNTANLDGRLAVVEAGQSAGQKGYATYAELVADTAPGPGAVGLVTNDASPANNGTWRKSAPSGQAGWVQSADRVSGLEQDLSEIRPRVEGVEQGGAPMPSINAGNVELLGFDAQGRAIVRFAPSSIADIADQLDITGVSELSARTEGVEQEEADFPAIMSSGLELLGFDAGGRMHANPSPDFARKVAALSGSGNGSYDPFNAGLLPSPTVTCWGDSMTAGGSVSITTVLANELGRTVNNRGKGGQDTLSIAIRQGGIPLTVTLASDQIPASGPVAITAKNSNILTSGGVNTGTANVSISGVRGVISTDSSGNWAFTRDASGAVVPVSAGTQAVLTEVGTSFIPAPEPSRDDTIIIWAGRNGDRSTRSARVDTRDRILAMIKYLTPLTKRVLVVSVCNGGAGGDGNPNEGAGTTEYERIAALNAELKETFGPTFVDLRSYMVRHAIYDAGLTPTAIDLDDISKDSIPDSLRTDSVHFTDAGYTQAGRFLARQIQMRGW